MDNNVSAQQRQGTTKGSNHRLRNAGKVPGNIYGLNLRNMNVEFGQLELFQALSEIGEYGVVEVDLNGKREKTIIKELQRDPITRKIVHIDLQRVDPNKKVHTHIPVVLKGEDMLNQHDAIVQRQLDDVEVECTPTNIPKYVTVDVSIMHPGQRITYGDVELSGEISIVGDKNTIIATISKRKINVESIDEPNFDRTEYIENETMKH